MIIDSKPALVMDKSFLQSISDKRLKGIADRYTFVVTSALYYELLPPLDNSRRSILARLGTFRRIHTPVLRRDERKHGVPHQIRALDSLTVNPKVISGGRAMTEEEHTIQKEYESEVVIPEIEFWRDVMRQGVLGFEDVDWAAVRADRSRLEPLLAKLCDRSFMRWIARETGFPHHELIDETWFSYRSLQAKLIHGLFLYGCYPNPQAPRKELDLEHDVHDTDYLSLGLHLGRFATNESQKDFRKLGWRFKFLCPEGELIANQA